MTDSENQPERQSWWKTPTGIGSLILAFATIVGAVIGGLFVLASNNDGSAPVDTTSNVSSSTSSTVASRPSSEPIHRRLVLPVDFYIDVDDWDISDDAYRSSNDLTADSTLGIRLVKSDDKMVVIDPLLASKLIRRLFMARACSLPYSRRAMNRSLLEISFAYEPISMSSSCG
jgi:hypothetical protein